MTERETSAEIDAVAAEWAVRIDASPLMAAEQATFDSWISADIRRLGAYARANAALIQARRAKVLDPAAYVAPVEEKRVFFCDAASDVEHEQPNRRRVLARGLSAAVAVGATLAFGVSRQLAANTYTTEHGEILLVPLADGSRMTLNTASKAKVRFSKDERRVEMQDGEALFDVTKDVSRPFLVIAGDMQIRAVGTSFTVRHLPGKPLQVIVREGAVDIGPVHQPLATLKRVKAHTRVIAKSSLDITTSPLNVPDLDREMAWREGMLSFEDEALGDVVQEFSRYSDRRIILANPQIARETITGLYAANDPQGFARSVALSLGCQVDVTPEGIILTR